MSNIVRHPQWPPQPPQPQPCGCGDPCCDGSCGCGPSLPNWSGGFLSCWNQIAQMENVFSTIIKRLIMDPSSGVMDAIIKGITDTDTSAGGGTTLGGNVIISSTQPGNPATGAQWWNGSILQVWDGTKWNTVGPGAAAGPVPTTTHTFSITVPSAYTVAANAWAQVPFTSTPVIDTQGSWNSVTRQITPTKAGLYLVFVRAPLSSTSGTTVGIGLPKNDPGSITGSINWIAIHTDYGGTSVASGWIGAVGMVIMNGTTDFLRLYVYCNGTVPANALPYLDMYLMP